jgi:membrane dipeptidase
MFLVFTRAVDERHQKIMYTQAVKIICVLLLISSQALAQYSAVPSSHYFGVDTHLHLTMSKAAKPLFQGEPGQGLLTDSPESRLSNQVEFKLMREAKINLVYGALWPPIRMRPGRTSLEETLEQLRQLEDFTYRQPGFVVVSTVADARAAMAKNKVAVFPQIEGGEGLEKPDDVDAIYAAGARCVTLVHFVSSHLAGEAAGQMSRNLMGKKPDGELNPVGLSAMGKLVVARMIDLGIVIDVAHASDQTVNDILAIAEPRGVPILVSHTGSRALVNMERNVSDEMAARIVKGGGLVAVSAFAKQLETPKEYFISKEHQVGTCDDLIAHWKHLASVIRPEGIVFGSDMNGFIMRPKPGGQCANGIRNMGDMAAVWSALERNGIPQTAITGMGEALLKMISTVEEKADKEAQRAALSMRAKLLKKRSALDVPQ